MEITTEKVEQLQKSLDEIQKRSARVSVIEDRLDRIETAANRPHFGPMGSGHAAGAEAKAFEALARHGDDSEIKALSVGSEPDGGYLVVADLRDRIIQRVFDTSPVRQRAAIMETDSDAIELLVDKTEAGAAWAAELESRSETDTPEWAVQRIPVQEIYAMPASSQKLLDDARLDVAEWLVDKVGRRFARKQNAAFVNGDGVIEPRGFNTYPVTNLANRAWGSIAAVYTGSDGAFPGTDPADVLFDAVGDLQPEYRAGAAWAMNRTTYAAVRKLKDRDGQYLLQRGIAGGAPDMLLGHPVTIFDDLGDYTTTDERAIYLADWSQFYTVVDRVGISVLRDPYSSKPKVLFYTRARVGGDVVNTDAARTIIFGSA